MKPEISRCPTCGRRKRRSSQANARYWLLVHMIAEEVKPLGQLYAAEAWHEWFKSRFLGCDELTLPNGHAMERPHSSADLDQTEFNVFMEKVEAWAAERGVFLEMEAA